MTKTRENTMADGRENAMAEEKKGNVEAEMRDSIWSVPFVVLMAVNFFQSMAAFMANATLPVFADSLGATASMVGVVVSSFTLSALLVRPFACLLYTSVSDFLEVADAISRKMKRRPLKRTETFWERHLQLRHGIRSYHCNYLSRPSRRDDAMPDGPAPR